MSEGLSSAVDSQNITVPGKLSVWLLKPESSLLGSRVEPTIKVAQILAVSGVVSLWGGETDFQNIPSVEEMAFFAA